MPGTIVTTATQGGPSAADVSPSSTFFVAGETQRGRVDAAVLVRSLGEFVRIFGPRITGGHTYDAIRTFFEEGGDKAYVVRTVGAGATSGTKTLMDKAGVPVATLKLDAIGPGVWSSAITVAVAAGSVTDTFKITLTDGTTTENYDNLATPAEAAAAINARSILATATDLGSVTAAPDNQPAVLAAAAFSAGAAGAAVVAADLLAALDDQAVASLGAGAVAIPGQDSSAVGAGLIAHAVANNRIALLATAQSAAVADAIAAAQTLRGGANAEYGGLFYPWVRVPDETVAGGTRLVPPEGYVAGCRARAHNTEGAWRAPAGALAQARYVIGVEANLGKDDAEQLDASEVNVIKLIANTVRLYGWRSLSSDETNYYFLSGRDVLNYIAFEADRRLEQFVFATIDPRGQLLASINAELVGLVEPMRLAGGLFELVDQYGDTIDKGYAVNTGPSVNPPAQLAQNIVAAELAVRISPTGAVVRILITKAGLAANL